MQPGTRISFSFICFLFVYFISIVFWIFLYMFRMALCCDAHVTIKHFDFDFVVVVVVVVGGTGRGNNTNPTWTSWRRTIRPASSIRTLLRSSPPSSSTPSSGWTSSPRRGPSTSSWRPNTTKVWESMAPRIEDQPVETPNMLCINVSTRWQRKGLLWSCVMLYWGIGSKFLLLEFMWNSNINTKIVGIWVTYLVAPLTKCQMSMLTYFHKFLADVFADELIRSSKSE